MADNQLIEIATRMQDAFDMTATEALQKYAELLKQETSFCAVGGCIVKMDDIKLRFDELVTGGMNRDSAYMLAIMEASEGMTQNDRP